MITLDELYKTQLARLICIDRISINAGRDWYAVGLGDNGFYLYSDSGHLPTVRVLAARNVDEARNSIELDIRAPMEWMGLYGAVITVSAEFRRTP